MDYKDKFIEIDNYLYNITVSHDDVMRLAAARQLLKALMEEIVAAEKQQ